MRDSALVSRPVCRLNKILVASPGYLAHHAVPRMIEDLQQHKLVARRFLGARWMPGASKRKTAVSRRLIRRIQRSSRCPRRKLLLKPQSMASVLRRWGASRLGPFGIRQVEGSPSPSASPWDIRDGDPVSPPCPDCATCSCGCGLLAGSVYYEPRSACAAGLARRILGLRLARTASNMEIAATLHISVETVKTHVRQILMRMGARNRTEIASMYQRVVQADGPKG